MHGPVVLTRDVTFKVNAHVGTEKYVLTCIAKKRSSGAASCHKVLFHSQSLVSPQDTVITCKLTRTLQKNVLPTCIIDMSSTISYCRGLKRLMTGFHSKIAW